MLILMPGNQPKKKKHPFDFYEGGYTINSQNYNFLIKNANFFSF